MVFATSGGGWALRRSTHKDWNVQLLILSIFESEC